MACINQQSVHVDYSNLIDTCVFISSLTPRLCTDPRVSKGATEAAIELLPIITIQEDTEGIDGSCPICLSDMVVGEEVRVLTCRHTFHRACLDEWLRVNASCPTCRTSIFESKDAAADDLGASVSPLHGDNTSNQHRILPTSDTDD
jgi:hypothetical protein